MLRRRPPLPDELRPAWSAFLTSAEALAAARRRLLSTLPAGRVEPGPVGLGLDAMATALASARDLLPQWRDEPDAQVWQACAQGLEESAAALPSARDVALTSRELDDLIGAFADVVDPLDAFADAERAWRRRWRVAISRP